MEAVCKARHSCRNVNTKLCDMFGNNGDACKHFKMG